MNPGGTELPEKLYYEGNYALGNTLKTQIVHQEALNQFEKNILLFQEDINTQLLNYRQYEEYIDSFEKNIKQEITDFRTQTCLRFLEIQQETENLALLEKAVTDTLAQINQKIADNYQLLEEERKAISNTQNFEVTTTQYHEVLQEQNQNLKNDLVFNNNDYQLRAQITWYSNEYHLLDSKISKISFNIPNFDKEAKQLTAKINETINQIEQLNGTKQKILKELPQQDDIELNQKKIKDLQRESKRVLNIVREYHQIQKDLVSRISTITTKCVKYDVLNQKYSKLIKELRTKEDSSNSFMFRQILLDDDNERSDQVFKDKSNRITHMSYSIKEQKSTLKRQIYNVRKTIDGHKQTIKFLKQKIREYSGQEKSLNEQLSEIQDFSNILDLKYQKMKQKIRKIKEFIKNKERESIKKITKFVNRPLRPFLYEIDQIHDEQDLALKVGQVNDQISLLRNQISIYEKENNILFKKMKSKQKKIEKIQRNQIAFYTQKSNQLKSIPTEIAPIDKLKIIIGNTERKISNKSLSLSKKKDRIKYKLSVINNVEQYLNENKKHSSSNKPINIKNKKQDFQINLALNNFQKWKTIVEDEILKWEVIKIDDSIIDYLHKWDQNLPLINFDYSYSELSE